MASITARTSYTRDRFSGTRWRSSALVGTRPLLDLAAEVREVLLRRRHGRRVVVDGDVDDAVGDLRLERADLGRLVHAETAAFDHRRTAHRDVRARDADDRRRNIRGCAAFPAKQYPDAIPTSGTNPLSRAK